MFRGGGLGTWWTPPAQLPVPTAPVLKFVKCAAERQHASPLRSRELTPRSALLSSEEIRMTHRWADQMYGQLLLGVLGFDPKGSVVYYFLLFFMLIRA